MRLNVVEIAKEAFKNKEGLVIEELPEDKVEIWYKNKRMYRKIGGTDPRPFILPRLIELDEEFAEAIGLYLGDGKTTESDTHHLDFVNKDCDIIVFMLNFFNERLLANLNKMTISIKYKYGNKYRILEKWSKWLSIPKSKFKISYQPRNRYDTISIQINSSVLRKVFFEIIKVALNSIKSNKNLRRGFLRGYFAAEGTVGYNEKENYLNYVGFSYNPKTEAWLRNYCILCLAKENIVSVFRERNGNKGEIIVTKWANYQKLLSIQIFDRCERKKKKFLEILMTRDIYCDLTRNFRQSMFTSLGMTQNQISKIIDSYQGNVSKTIHGMHLLSKHQIKDLLPYTNLSLLDFIKNTQAIRIGNSELISDREFIENILKQD